MARDTKECKYTLITDAYCPIEIAKIGKYRWPYVMVGAHIIGLAERAKYTGRHIVCVNVDYLGIGSEEKSHHCRITAYLTKGLCGHEKIEDCIASLEEWEVGPCYPRLDFHESMIVGITRKMKGL